MTHAVDSVLNFSFSSVYSLKPSQRLLVLVDLNVCFTLSLTACLSVYLSVSVSRHRNISSLRLLVCILSELV